MPNTFLVGSLIAEKANPIWGYLLVLRLRFGDLAMDSRSALFLSSLTRRDSDRALEEKYLDDSGLKSLSPA